MQSKTTDEYRLARMRQQQTVSHGKRSARLKMMRALTQLSWSHSAHSISVHPRLSVVELRRAAAASNENRRA